MNRLTAFFKKLRLRQLLTVFVVSVLLVATIPNVSGELYPGAETPAGRAEKEAELPVITEKDFEQPESGGLNQRNPDLGERIQNRLEAVKDTFMEAKDFVKEKANEAGARPEGQSNPALH